MRNRSVLYFAGFIFALLGFLMFDYLLRKDYIVKNNQPYLTDEATVEGAQPEVSDLELRTRFLNRFQNFATRMRAISDEPEESEEFLREFSQTIQSSDIIALGEILKNTKMKNTERTLALELMVMNQDFTSHNLLNIFAQDEYFAAHSNAEFEIALRAQAIEGLTLFADKKLVRKNLENLKIRTKHAFLYDRADRGLAYLSDQNLAVQMESADAKASKR